MKVGDLVVSKYDVDRGLDCIGLIIETGREDPPYVACKVLWSSESHPIGWWTQSQLRRINESN